MADTNVLFIWKPREDLENYLREGLKTVKNLNIIFPEEETEEVYLKHSRDANIIVGWRPTRELLDSAENLQLHIFPGVGVQHLLEPFRDLVKTRDIVLVNGHGNTYFAAQHTVALLLALTNKVIPHHNWMVEGFWRRGDSHEKTKPLRHRNIGLLGYGAVNQKVHRFLSGFDVDFFICRNSWKGKSEDLPTPVTKYETNQLDEFLQKIDTLIIAVPQTPDTLGLIGQKELELLGSDGLVVNVARGPVLEEDALFNVLREKKIAGAAIDVWYEYQPEPDVDNRKFPYSKRFHELDNIVLSPHRAASPFDDLERWDEVVENITRFAQGRTDFLNMVDLEKGY